MGCNANTKDIMDESLYEQMIKKIKDNLEANLISQSTFNLELNNIYIKNDDKNNTSENIVNAYCDLLFNLAIISKKKEKEKEKIKELLSFLKNISYNNFYTFYITLYRKLQGLKDYSNIKSNIEKDLILKNCIKRNKLILLEVIENLKAQKIINVSQLSRETFQKACEKRGVRMNSNQISSYFKVLNMKPNEYNGITENMRKEFDENENLKNNIDKYGNEFKNIIDEIIKDGINCENIDFEKFNEMAKQYQIKLELNELEEIYKLIQKNFLEFISYIDYLILIQNNTNYDETLEIKAKKLDTLARIESQPLPLVKKLSNYI